MGRKKIFLTAGRKKCSRSNCINVNKYNDGFLDKTEFLKDRSTNSNLASHCKDCSRRDSKKWRIENKDTLKKYNSAYNNKNSLEISKKRFLKRNSEIPQKVWAKDVIGSHKYRGYRVNIDFKELVKLATKIKICCFCDKKLNWRRRRKRIRMNSPSLENLNGRKILTLSEATIICYECNKSKGGKDINEFLDYCENIYKNKKKILKRIKK